MCPFRNASNSGFNLRRTFFRRDAERAFYTGKPFPLPGLTQITSDNLASFKKNFPLNFASGKEDIFLSRNIFLELVDKNKIIIEGNRVRDRIFIFPNGREVFIGEQINWNRDYVSGFQWNNNLAWKENFFSFPSGTDIFNAWLPARLNQLIYLGKAYLATGNEEYVKSYITLLDDFKSGNPLGTGVNWIESREVSIRLLNIIFSLPMVIHSDHIKEEFLNNVRNFVLLHTIFIENNLTSDLQEYDIVISLAALAVAGLIFHDSDYGKRILYLGLSKAENAIRKMISPDGVTRTGSLPHTPLFAEAFFLIRYAATKAKLKISSSLDERFTRMLDVLASVLRDDDSIAQLGESVPARILPLSDNENNYPLAYGCYELNKARYKNFFPSPLPDILFYFGADAVKKYKDIEEEVYPRISYGYTRSGIFVLRNDNIHITVDAEPITHHKKKTAGHNDILSYELFFKGQKIISDPGMYSMFADEETRSILRSVKSHSTFYIDDQEPSEFDDLYSVKEDLTNPKVTEWRSDEYEDFLSVQHYAYARFSDPVIVKRIFRLLKEENKLIIRNELFGGSTHQAVSNIIFHPNVSVIQNDVNAFSIISPVKGEITVSSPVSLLNCSLQENIFSNGYGNLTKTKKITTSLTAQFPVYLTTEIKLI